MADSVQSQIEKLRKSMAVLEAQRAILGDDTVEPALAALRQQLASFEVHAVPAAPSEERRVVTILFADIVGSTSLAEKLDPEEWTEIIKPAFESLIPPVYDHGGTVARLMGDAILAFFGAPQAHEDDAERAILAGLAILDRVGEYARRLNAERNVELKVRVGINTGLVVVGNIGSDLKSEYTAMGDAINLAARLQSSAPPGNILISSDTYSYVRGVFDVTPQPPLMVKGKSEPIKTYLVQRARAHPFRAAIRGVAGIQTRTIGRDQELKQLQDAYLDAYQNRRIVWAQLLGEPGVGKSRLLQDMIEWLDLRPEEFRLLRARAFLGDTGHAFALIRRMWFDRFQIAEDVPLPVAEASWMRAFKNLSGISEEEPAQALGLLTGLSFDGSPHLGAMRYDPVQVRGRAFVVSREVIRAMRSQAPLVLVLEDLHWADASSWEYLVEVFLQAKEADQGLFIIGSARPEWNPPEAISSALGSHYVQINLAPLASAASRELTVELLRRVEGVPADVVHSIVERSEGVPYFAEELVNLFIDRGLIDQSQEPWRFKAEGLRGLLLPATLQHLLHTRLLALPVGQRVCLQRSSIFGRHFWEGGLQALGVNDPNVLLNPLQPRGFVEAQFESSFLGEHEWSFHHALLRDVTYESVLKRERLWLHKEVAGWLEAQARQAGRLDEFAGALGEHAESAGEFRVAAIWYARAGEHAKGQGATREANKFFDRALEHLPADERERRWKILLNREEVLGILGKTEARRADVLALLELAQELGDETKLAEALHRQAYFLVYSGDYAGCLAACEQALASAHRAGDERLEMLILSLQVPALVRSGDLVKARATAEEALSRARALGDKSALVGALLRIGMYYLETGDATRYIELMDEEIRVSREIGNRRSEIMGLSNLGESYSRLGLYRLSRAHQEQAKELAEAIAARNSRAYAIWNLASIYLHMSHNRTAQGLLEEALEEFKSTHDTYAEQGVRLELAIVLEEVGDLSGAQRLLAEVRGKLTQSDIADRGSEAEAGLARCALSLGRLDEAREYADHVAAFLDRGAATAENPFHSYETCARVYLAVGEQELARTIARAGYRELMRRAERISNLEWQRSFLENVPENRAIVELEQRLDIQAYSVPAEPNPVRLLATEEGQGV